MQYIRQYLTALVNLTMEMGPYILLGFLFAGILYVWFPKKKVYKYLGKPISASVINAALIGIPLPLCSCGVIPTGISFYNSGASKGSSVSFLISTPQTGVDSALVTYSLLGLPMGPAQYSGVTPSIILPGLRFTHSHQDQKATLTRLARATIATGFLLTRKAASSS